MHPKQLFVQSLAADMQSAARAHAIGLAIGHLIAKTIFAVFALYGFICLIAGA